MTVLEPGSLADCELARDSLRKAEDGVTAARVAFERSVRRLYVEGGSTREIAQALGLSHQRVHQIVGADQASWWQRLLPPLPEPNRQCSFCGRGAREVAKLVAGPGDLYICDSCIGEADAAMPPGLHPGEGRFERLPPDSSKRCSFCGSRKRGLARASASGHQICNGCLGLAKEIVTTGP